METYASEALKSVSFRNDSGYDDSEGVEISTPLGSMLVTGEVCFYEDGSVKSVSGFKAPQGNERFTVNTNFGILSISGGHNKDFRITFYPSGALWHVVRYVLDFNRFYNGKEEPPIFRKQFIDLKDKILVPLSYIKIKNLIKYHNNKADSILPSHKRAAMSVSPVFGNAIAAFYF